MEPEAPKPLKKLNTFTNCFIISFLLVWAYLEFFVKLKSIYWTIGQFVAFLIMLTTTLILRRIRNKETWGTIIASAAIWLVLLGMMSSREITKYKNNVCLDKFGKEFNQRRRNLGIPVIPADWHIDFQGNRSTDWKKNDTTGHYWKMTYVDSLCALDLELDEYNLKPARGGARSIEISARFAKRKGSDTISFRYDDGDSTKAITRLQADSIFAVEKIQKDY